MKVASILTDRVVHLNGGDTPHRIVLTTPNPSIYQTNQDSNQVTLLRECWCGCNVTCNIDAIFKYRSVRATTKQR